MRRHIASPNQGAALGYGGFYDWSRKNTTLVELFRKASGTMPKEKQVKLARKMAAKHPAEYASHILLAQALMQAAQWPEVREQLKKALIKGDTAQACRMMAEVELGQYSDYDAHGRWLSRSAAAPGADEMKPAEKSLALVGDRMARARQRLSVDHDPGTTTQIIQERILLDTLRTEGSKGGEALSKLICQDPSQNAVSQCVSRLRSRLCDLFSSSKRGRAILKMSF